MDESALLTEQLQRFSGGDRDIAEAVLRKVLPELHRIALRELRRERYLAPVSATELVHEVWLQSLCKGGWQIESRTHFYAIAALAMRRVLVNFARQRLAQKRGQGELPVSLQTSGAERQAYDANLERIVNVGLLMEKLEAENPEYARIIDLHFFAGFKIEEITEITGLSARQVRTLWVKGRNWLKRSMTH